MSESRACWLVSWLDLFITPSCPRRDTGAGLRFQKVSMSESRACWLVSWLDLFTAELSYKEILARGPRFQEVSMSVSCLLVGWLVG